MTSALLMLHVFVYNIVNDYKVKTKRALSPKLKVLNDTAVILKNNILSVINDNFSKYGKDR